MIPNTFSGFGSMTVRNTNMVTMSSFVVMFHEKRSEENRNTIIYTIICLKSVWRRSPNAVRNSGSIASGDVSN